MPAESPLQGRTDRRENLFLVRLRAVAETALLRWQPQGNRLYPGKIHRRGDKARLSVRLQAFGQGAVLRRHAQDALIRLPQQDHQPGQTARDGGHRDSGRGGILGAFGAGVMVGGDIIYHLLHRRVHQLCRQQQHTKREDQPAFARRQVQREGQRGRGDVDGEPLPQRFLVAP
ncbi:UNVERIFIED_CONTAM: hypothetical protein NCL1_02915 [Trichonephila clavipes]